MAETIKGFILDYHRNHPKATYEQIHTHVVKHFKGCSTTVASVACTLSRERKLKVVGHVDVAGTKEFADLKDEHNVDETDDEIRRRIGIRYDAMARMSQRLIDGQIPSLIVSGPPGIGKSYTIADAIKRSGRQRHDGLTNVGGGGKMTIEQFEAFKEESYDRDEEDDDEDGDREDGDFIEEGIISSKTEAKPKAFSTTGWYDQISGSITPVGLYHALWNMRKGGVLILDDCDDIFRDETSLNLLKIATDSTKERLVSWRKQASWLEEYGIDRTFDFQGHIIFLTNIDFEDVIERGHKDSEHFKAIIDRALYLCLTLRTKRDFMVRIGDVSTGETGMLRKHFGLDEAQTEMLLKFVADNQKRFYNLSLRLVGQIALCMKADPEGWKQDIEATKMRTRA